MRYSYLKHLNLKNALKKTFGSSYVDIDVNYNPLYDITTVDLNGTTLAEFHWQEAALDYDPDWFSLIARWIYDLYSNRSLRKFGCSDTFLCYRRVPYE